MSRKTDWFSVGRILLAGGVCLYLVLAAAKVIKF
jgi:hypothetical protein